MEKIFKREDGSKVKVTVDLYLITYRRELFTYRTEVRYKRKYGRTWLHLPKDISDWDFRSMSEEERREYLLENRKRFISDEEVYQVQLEYWKSLKPQRGGDSK